MSDMKSTAAPDLTPPALGVTFRGFAETLALIAEPPSLATARRQMARRAPAILGGLVRHGARRLERRPLADIAARLYGFGRAPAELSAGRLLAKAEAAYAGERMRGRSGHWSYDFNRQLGLAEIVVALRRRVRSV